MRISRLCGTRFGSCPPTQILDPSVSLIAIDARMGLKALRASDRSAYRLLCQAKIVDHDIFDGSALKHGHTHIVAGSSAPVASGQSSNPSALLGRGGRAVPLPKNSAAAAIRATVACSSLADKRNDPTEIAKRQAVRMGYDSRGMGFPASRLNGFWWICLPGPPRRSDVARPSVR